MSRKLYRNIKDGKIGGVCSGLADYFDLDVVLFRAIFLISLFMGGLGLLIYIVLWLITPESPTDTQE